MMKSVLQELSQHRQYPCISVIISTQINSFAEKKKVQLKVKNQVKEAEIALRNRFPEETTKPLIQALNDIARKFDVDSASSGVGFFVSDGFQRTLLFPLPVVDKLLIGEDFDTMTIEQVLENMFDYNVLVLSKNKTRLLQGWGNQLKEVEDGNFPEQYDHQFEVNRTSPGSFYNPEESDFEQTRLQQYIRHLDHLLQRYEKRSPLVLMGVVKQLSEFGSISKFAKDTIVEIQGNFESASTHELAKKVWPKVESYRDSLKLAN